MTTPLRRYAFVWGDGLRRLVEAEDAADAKVIFEQQMRKCGIPDYGIVALVQDTCDQCCGQYKNERCWKCGGTGKIAERPEGEVR